MIMNTLKKILFSMCNEYGHMSDIAINDIWYMCFDNKNNKLYTVQASSDGFY